MHIRTTYVAVVIIITPTHEYIDKLSSRRLLIQRCRARNSYRRKKNIINELSNVVILNSFINISNNRAPVLSYIFRMFLQYAIAFENQNAKFYTLKSPVAKSFVQMMMARGFPLRDKINFKIRLVRMVEKSYELCAQFISQHVSHICASTRAL